MNGRSKIKAAYQTMLEEHRELMGQIHDLREWVNEVSDLGIPHFGELGSRLQPLRDELAQHFKDEEAGGYLAEALAVAPRLTREARELQPQHGELLAQLDDLIGRLHQTEPPFSSWQQACREFEEVLTTLRRHEGRETALMQAAFEDDIAPAD